MRKLLKILAGLCKVTAVAFWLFAAWVGIDLDASILRGGYSSYRDPAPDNLTLILEIAGLTALALLALLPNRWLVFRPWLFVPSLLIALIPFCKILDSPIERSDLLWMMSLMFLFAMLPLSLILSFWRQRKGEGVGYV